MEYVHNKIFLNVFRNYGTTKTLIYNGKKILRVLVLFEQIL